MQISWIFCQDLIYSEFLAYKFLKQLNFDLYLTKPKENNLESIMNDIISIGFQG